MMVVPVDVPNDSSPREQIISSDYQQAKGTEMTWSRQRDAEGRGGPAGGTRPRDRAAMQCRSQLESTI